ncbi:hypothetical protein C8J57DRAFT_1492086 [Mycena rebaudengoi]|nr:hypothetical protein C8J57DRAFT_1492086 [Mycena rebaudengoi]
MRSSRSCSFVLHAEDILHSFVPFLFHLGFCIACAGRRGWVFEAPREFPSSDLFSSALLSLPPSSTPLDTDSLLFIPQLPLSVSQYRIYVPMPVPPGLVHATASTQQTRCPPAAIPPQVFPPTAPLRHQNTPASPRACASARRVTGVSG